MAECMTPFGVKNKYTGETVPVPCGKCPACVARRASAWSFRLMQEDKRSLSSWFITLTYDTANVPIHPSGFMSVRKRDLQLFFKRLRKATSKHRRIKYYAVAEYGGRTYRPHYHVILFNAEVEKISPAWNLGHVYYGTVTGASVGYCLKYMSKKGKIPMHANDDRVPEFALMSKRLGDNFLSPAMIKWYMADIDNRMYCPMPDGKKISMPRYYKDRLFSADNFETAEHAAYVRKRVAFFTRQRTVNAELERMREEGEAYWRNKAERVKAAFRRKDYRSCLNESL